MRALGHSHSPLALSWSLSHCPGPDPPALCPPGPPGIEGRAAAVPGLGGTVPSTQQANHQADKKNWNMEIIKRRDLKIIAGMNRNKEHHSPNMI